LVIGDKSLVHGYRLETREKNSWKWRLYLPAGHQFIAKVAFDDIPPKGIPTQCALSEHLYEEGELLLTADIGQRSNQSTLTLEHINQKLDRVKGVYYDAEGGLLSSRVANVPDTVWPEICVEFVNESFGASGLETSTPDTPVVLLKIWGHSDKNGPGMMIWLEEENADYPPKS